DAGLERDEALAGLEGLEVQAFMQALETAGRAGLDVVDQGQQAEMIFIQAAEYVQWPYQLLQASRHAPQQLVMIFLAVPVPLGCQFLQADQQIAQRAAATLDLPQAVAQLLVHVAR